MKLTAKQRRRLEQRAAEQRREMGLPCSSFKKVLASMTDEQRMDLMRQLFPERTQSSTKGDDNVNNEVF